MSPGRATGAAAREAPVSNNVITKLTNTILEIFLMVASFSKDLVLRVCYTSPKIFVKQKSPP
jgi:hypothetical protein